jgi:hypothetical protein
MFHNIKKILVKVNYHLHALLQRWLLELNGQIGKNKWLMIKHVLPHEIKRVYLD